MKVRFDVSEQEKNKILEQHSFFKKVLQSKVKRLMINEQTQPTGGGRAFLIAARDKNCKIAVGGKLMTAPGKPTVLYKKADYTSPNGYFNEGDELYIKDDFTFDVVTTDANGNKTLKASGKKWECAALTDPFKQQVTQNIERIKKEGNWHTKEEWIASGATEQNLENPQMYEKEEIDGTMLYRSKASSSIGSGLTSDQQSIINRWHDKGFKLRNELTPGQAKTFKPSVVSPASEGYFSQDLIMYFDPSSVQGIKKTDDEGNETTINITTVAQDAVNNRIPKDQADCVKTIEAYYLDYIKKRPLEPDEFEALKDKTQACKNEYYKDWGIFRKGKKMDNYLDILSGGLGGPSLRGENSKWRLN
jgi:hypothetical protein